MSLRNGGLDPQSAAKKAVVAIGLGYDVCRDVRLSGCKARVVELPNNQSETLVFPGGVIIPDVSASIKCHPGESFRDFSEVLSFLQDGRDVRWKVDVALAAAVRPIVKSHSTEEDLISISVRRGGIVGIHQHHKEWLSTISQSRDAISMLFVPIILLLSSLPGHGFLSHAMNWYLRHKPKI